MERHGKNPQLHEEVELHLGLSMNGRFGVDPARGEMLGRSSLVANTAFAVVGDSRGPTGATEFESHAAALGRTRSLPTETEEALYRRKKSITPMEARKERMDKRRASREKNLGKRGLGEGVHGTFTDWRVPDGSVLRRFKNGSVMVLPQGLVGPAGSSSPPDPIEVVKPKQNEEVCGQGSHQPKNPVHCMPSVTTKDIGPNGRKVQGLLYKYEKEGDVKIMCVCHGVFFTPKEFVAHGGGVDVEHPLKHIVVSRFPPK